MKLDSIRAYDMLTIDLLRNDIKQVLVNNEDFPIEEGERWRIYMVALLQAGTKIKIIFNNNSKTVYSG